MRGFPQPTYPSPPSVAPVPQLTREQEVQMLESQMDLLQNQLDQIKKRLKELEKK